MVKKCKHCGAEMDIYPSISGGYFLWMCPYGCVLMDVD